MSIWCSWEHIGTDPHDGKWRDMDGNPMPPEGAERGVVLSYAEGFSNHYPDDSGEYERPAVIALSSIAPWCTPGHDEASVDHDAVGGWLRLEVAAPEVLNFWAKDADGKPTVEEEGATVVLDVAAATALRDDLNHWLSLSRVHPKPTE